MTRRYSRIDKPHHRASFADLFVVSIAMIIAVSFIFMFTWFLFLLTLSGR